MCNKFNFLPAGSVKLKGPLGKALDLTITNRLKKINYKYLVDPFRTRDEELWRGEFWGKIVRSTILAWYSTKDPELLTIIKETVADILTAQTSDGCFTSYPETKRFTRCDIWCRKYVLFGLIRYYEMVEADEHVKNACCDLVDNLMTDIGPGKINICDTDNHGGLASCSILGGIVRLYRISGDKKYLNYAEWIADSGCSKKHNVFKEACKLTHPKDIGNAKAYELMACFQGLSELYLETPKEEYHEAIIKFYKMVRDREIFITGVGGLKDCCGEFWYDGKFKQTGNDSGMLGETCVTTTWIHYCERVLNLTADSTVGDELERAFYNGVIGAMKPDGTNWVHMNPTPLDGASFKKPTVDQMTLNQGTPFHGHDCCLAQGPEALAMAPLLAVMTDEQGVVLNTFEDLIAEFTVPSGRKVSLEITGGYPGCGKVKLKFRMKASAEFTIKLRIPTWWNDKCNIKVMEKENKAEAGKYLELHHEWTNGDTIELNFDLSPRVVDDLGDTNRKAYLCGPIVLAQDSRLGLVDSPVTGVDGMESVDKGEKDSDFYIVKKLSDGSMLCDYASAGNLFTPDNTLCVWLRKSE
jgi:DUF1680 family protein